MTDSIDKLYCFNNFLVLAYKYVILNLGITIGISTFNVSKTPFNSAQYLISLGPPINATVLNNHSSTTGRVTTLLEILSGSLSMISNKFCFV